MYVWFRWLFYVISFIYLPELSVISSVSFFFSDVTVDIDLFSGSDFLSLFYLPFFTYLEVPGHSDSVPGHKHSSLNVFLFSFFCSDFSISFFITDFQRVYKSQKSTGMTLLIPLRTDEIEGLSISWFVTTYPWVPEVRLFLWLFRTCLRQDPPETVSVFVVTCGFQYDDPRPQVTKKTLLSDWKEPRNMEIGD